MTKYEVFAEHQKTNKNQVRQTGNYYYGARYYNPKWNVWLSVDPLAEKYPEISPYVYVANNPIRFVDPDGRSIGVRKNDDGNYEVVSGNAKDNNRGVYLVDKDGKYDVDKSERIGTTKTTHSFFNDNEKVVEGAIINLNSNEGQEFLDGLIEDNPNLAEYMYHARNKEKYDLKDKGIDERSENKSKLQHRYRGSVDKEGEIGSARDFGNIGAGLVAAREGLSWKEARAGFDTYQGYSKNGITTIPGVIIPTVLPVREPTTTVKAQMIGFSMGLQRYKKHNR
jgi:RHS repeat-associated protein